MSTSSHRQALAHLRRADPVIARVIKAVGPYRFQVRAEGTHFDALVRAIVYQQLSGKAAATIHSRLKALFGGRDPTPAELLAIPEETLRGVGLSRQKLGYVRDLAARVASGELPIDNLHELDDDALTEALVRVKGIGRWTAQMFLMFRLGRPNVLPELDLGIQNGMQRAYGLRARPKPKDVLRIGERWAPYASTASWYLWRVLEVPAWDTATRNVGLTGRKSGGTRTVTRDKGRGKGAAKRRATATRKKQGTRKGAAKRSATTKNSTTRKTTTTRKKRSKKS